MLNSDDILQSLESFCLWTFPVFLLTEEVSLTATKFYLHQVKRSLAIKFYNSVSDFSFGNSINP